MADDNKPIIDLSKAQDAESKAADDNDILSLEDELLGSTNSQTAAKTRTKTNKFHIPKAVKDEHPELIPLILDTESMDDEEREYWFQILPIMTADQIAKFKDILVTEKKQLEKLDKEYEAELTKINEKHLQEWQEFESREKKMEREKKEQAVEKQESSVEEDLLNKLQNL